MKHMTDAALNEQIRFTRRLLASLPAGNCLGRRTANADLRRLEGEMMRRYEGEMWGAERG